jgi:hypothetical protein
VCWPGAERRSWSWMSVLEWCRSRAATVRAPRKWTQRRPADAASAPHRIRVSGLQSPVGLVLSIFTFTRAKR